jgi:hypothetical protein
LIGRQLGDSDTAGKHLALYRKYKSDDNARDRAVALARSRDPAANHAAEAVVIYDLSREGAYETQGGLRRAEQFELSAPLRVARRAGDELPRERP